MLKQAVETRPRPTVRQTAHPAILLVGNHLSGAGYNPSVCEDLAARLHRRGWRVLATSTRPRRLARLCDMLATIWRLRQTYDLAHVDVYSGNAFVWAEAACRLLRAAGKPYAITLHGGNLAGFRRRWPRRVEAVLSHAAAVTTPSSYLLEQFHAARRDIHLIPNALEVDSYRYRPRVLAEPRLIWLRAFHRIYAPELAVATLAATVREFPDARLTMIGPDKGDGSLQRTTQLAARLGLERHVAFPGSAPKRSLPALLDHGDIFINTAVVDNAPVSVLEAMAGGLCVVSTDAGGLPYLLRHERDALLAPAGNASGLAAAVRRVLREPGLSGILSRNARRSVEPYDWSRILLLWERLFHSIAEVRAR